MFLKGSGLQVELKEERRWQGVPCGLGEEALNAYLHRDAQFLCRIIRRRAWKQICKDLGIKVEKYGFYPVTMREIKNLKDLSKGMTY
jgi:hypothetical protein